MRQEGGEGGGEGMGGDWAKYSGKTGNARVRDKYVSFRGNSGQNSPDNCCKRLETVMKERTNFH